jgi:hypothetical protein
MCYVFFFSFFLFSFPQAVSFFFSITTCIIFGTKSQSFLFLFSLAMNVYVYLYIYDVFLVCLMSLTLKESCQCFTGVMVGGNNK